MDENKEKMKMELLNLREQNRRFEQMVEQLEEQNMNLRKEIRFLKKN